MTNLSIDVADQNRSFMLLFETPLHYEVTMKKETLGTVSLLFVEDDASTRELVTRLLEKNGFNCIVAENGREGLELYRTHLPEIVLSDIMMPVMSGLEMARASGTISPRPSSFS
jgi:response regulator RpfG family c-di-GMP phosphodiesterase